MIRKDVTKIYTKKQIDVSIVILVLVVSVVAQTPNTDWYTSNTEADTFYISTADELAGLAQIVNGGISDLYGKIITLTADINLSRYGINYNNGKGWIPIGFGEITNTPHFSGTFDGSSFTISELYINDSLRSGVGLFGYINGGKIMNLGVVDIKIRGYNEVGGVVGDMGHGSNIIDCYSAGTVIGNNKIGGVVGTAGFNSPVVRCHSTTIVIGNMGVGGIVGNGMHMVNNFFAGAVSGDEYVGGVVGYLYYSVADHVVYDSYSTGTISGNKYIGGIVGGMAKGCRIERCYSISAVIGVNYVGGIVGSFENNAQVRATYIISCAALNPSVSGENAHRIIGGTSAMISDVYIQNCVAFDGMSGADFGSIGNGTDITIAEIHASRTLNNRFTSSNGWTTQAGKLPGLLGKAVDMPPHLQCPDCPVSVVPRTAFSVSSGSVFRFSPAVISGVTAVVRYSLSDDAVVTLSVYDLKGVRRYHAPASFRVSGSHNVSFKASRGFYIVEARVRDKSGIGEKKYIERINHFF